MSIPAAVEALNKEIEELDKKRNRLASLRDALIVEGKDGGSDAVSSVPAKGKRGRKPGATKAIKKTAIAKKAAAPKKRVLSTEARKKIADAQKARWAASKAVAKKTA